MTKTPLIVLGSILLVPLVLVGGFALALHIGFAPQKIAADEFKSKVALLEAPETWTELPSQYNETLILGACLPRMSPLQSCHSREARYDLSRTIESNEALVEQLGDRVKLIGPVTPCPKRDYLRGVDTSCIAEVEVDSYKLTIKLNYEYRTPGVINSIMVVVHPTNP